MCYSIEIFSDCFELIKYVVTILISDVWLPTRICCDNKINGCNRFLLNIKSFIYFCRGCKFPPCIISSDFIRMHSLITLPRFFSFVHHQGKICFTRPLNQLWPSYATIKEVTTATKHFIYTRDRFQMIKTGHFKIIWSCWGTVMYVSVWVQLECVLSLQISPEIMPLLLQTGKHSALLRAWLSAIQPFVLDKLRWSFGLSAAGLRICSKWKWKSDICCPSLLLQRITPRTEGGAVNPTKAGLLRLFIVKLFQAPLC